MPNLGHRHAALWQPPLMQWLHTQQRLNSSHPPPSPELSPLHQLNFPCPTMSTRLCVGCCNGTAAVAAIAASCMCCHGRKYCPGRAVLCKHGASMQCCGQLLATAGMQACSSLSSCMPHWLCLQLPPLQLQVERSSRISPVHRWYPVYI
jgi:hypothetical protein